MSTPPPLAPSPVAGSLAGIPRLLRADPVLGALLGAADATVAVPEAAQAVVAAALAAFTQRTPLLVVTPTGLDAERLVDDLGCLLEPDVGQRGEDDDGVGALVGAVSLLPAWETLPFERVSPEIETMGRRLAVLHALTQPSDGAVPSAPRVIVSPVRALLQRLAPLDVVAPIVLARGQQIESEVLLRELVDRGYRREHQVEHRGEFAVRGGIVDVFPSTADAPVRIDLWGDEVDRLTDLRDQRPAFLARHRRASILYGCRELARDRGAAPGGRRLMARRPWGASTWERLERGEQFDGMESWLPFLDGEARCCPTCCLRGRRSSSSSHGASATGRCSCSTRRPPWPRRSPPPGAPRRATRTRSPGCTCPSSGSCATARAGVVSLPPVPEGPSHVGAARRALRPGGG